jgi:hypothetical protein
MITAESFGSYLPKNWEEIAKFMNDAAEKWLEDLKKEDPEYFESHDESCIYDEIWDGYWNGWLAGAPEPQEQDYIVQQIATE